MRRKDEDHFIGGPWPHTSGGYEIKYQLNGKKKSEYRKNEAEAKERCEYWKKTLAPGAPADSEEEHPVHYWNRVLRNAAELLNRDPENKAIAASARALSALAAEGLKVAKYIPPPAQKASDSAADIDPTALNNMSSEELAGLLGNN